MKQMMLDVKLCCSSATTSNQTNENIKFQETVLCVYMCNLSHVYVSDKQDYSIPTCSRI